MGMKDESFKNWAKLQQNEIDERMGDGYSSWEYLKDSLGGIPEIVDRKISALNRNTWGPRFNNDEQSYPDTEGNKMLEAMRVIADKRQNPNYKTSFDDQTVMRSWKSMLDEGQVDLLPTDLYSKYGVKP